MKVCIIYFIVYPYGDESKLSVRAVTEYFKHEIRNYALASSKTWDNEWVAIERCKQLCEKFGKEYVPSGIDLHEYLD